MPRYREPSFRGLSHAMLLILAAFSGGASGCVHWGYEERCLTSDDHRLLLVNQRFVCHRVERELQPF